MYSLSYLLFFEDVKTVELVECNEIHSKAPKKEKKFGFIFLSFFPSPKAISSEEKVYGGN